VSAWQNKPARVAALAVAGSAVMVSAWPAAAHWMAHTPHPAGAGQADALGLRAAGTPSGPAGQQPAVAPGAAASQQPAVSSAASQQLEVVSIAIAGRPGRHRKPGYVNPLRSVSGLIPQRIDQGVDFGGTGPVYALGDAVITSSADGYSTGWPGGGWITYQLTDGPDAGLTVYLAEDVTPAVQVGQHVSPSTVIANMFAGGDGIETGWAEPGGLLAESQLPAAGGIGGGGPFPTRIGVSFDQLLQSLGVPAAPNSTQPAYGVLPAGYPANQG
jgi:hypothetical protein